LLVGKWADLLARQNQDANWDALAQHRNSEDRAEIAQSLRLHEGVFRISLYVGDMNHPAFEQRTPGRRTSFGLDWNTFDVIREFTSEAVGLRAVEGPVFLAGNVGLVGIAKPGG